MVMRAQTSARTQAQPRRRKPVQLAMMELAEQGSKLRVVRRPSGETARERLYELMREMGELYNGRELGWKAHVARQLKMPYTTLVQITLAGDRGELHSIRPETVDYAIQATGIPPSAFYDSEYGR